MSPPDPTRLEGFCFPLGGESFLKIMTLHLELSPEEESRLRAKAVSAGLDEVSYLRSLINGLDEANTASHASVTPNRLNGRSIAEMIDEIGVVEGLPSDLSTNPKYMEGFGETRNPRAFGS